MALPTDPLDPALPAVRFYRPPPPLQDLVTTFYVVEVQRPLVDHLHPEWGNIRLLTRGHWTTQMIGAEPDAFHVGSIYGPTDRTRRVETMTQAGAGTMFGIGLTPLGWSRLFEADAGRYANRVVDFEELLDISCAEMTARIVAAANEETAIAVLSDMVATRVSGPGRDDDVIRTIHRHLIAADYDNVAALAETVGMPERTLHRACLRAFGFPPKRLLRRQRFLRALDAVSTRYDQPLSRIFGDEYYDQPHFNREFKRYMGMTPSAYFKSPREVMRRAAIERQRAIGASLQGLHPAATAY